MQDLLYGWEPVVSIFADGERDLDLAAARVAAAGARVGARCSIDEAVGRLDEQASDAVVVHVAGEEQTPALARLLDRLNDDASAGRNASVVVIPEPLIDLAMARAPHQDVVLICCGTAADELAALSIALAPRAPLVLEERGDESPGQLRRLSEEVGRIARALAEMSGEEARVGSALPVPSETKDKDRVGEFALAPFLRMLIRNRRLRDQYFPPELFADPAWDMLIDLMLARVERRLVAVSSLCIAAAVPPTTALRWIKRLTDEGLFVRSADPRDGRRIYIDLSDACFERMTAYLRALAHPGSS